MKIHQILCLSQPLTPMARCSVPKPSGATTATTRLFGCHIAPNAISASKSASAARLPSLKKPSEPPPPLLSRRSKLPVPVPTISSVGTASDEDGRKKPSPEAAHSPPSLSGAGDVLRLLDALRLPPDKEVYISLLRDCTDAVEVVAVQAHIAGRSAAGGLLLLLANRVLLSYVACGDIGAARRLFDEMPTKNAMAWVTMVSAYSDRRLHRDAMCIFARMCHEARGLTDDCYAHAMVAVLRSSARPGEQRLSEQVHALVIKLDRVCGDVGSSLVQLYSEIDGLHLSARQVLVMMMPHHSQELVPDAAWTSLITSCHRDGLLNMAIDVFRDMVSTSVPRSSFSPSSILAVFAESENQVCCGQHVHADTFKRGMDANQFIGSGLVHMYAKQGQLPDAARAFEAISGKPDAVCWNAMAMAYARRGRYREATRVMYQMKAAGILLK